MKRFCITILSLLLLFPAGQAAAEETAESPKGPWAGKTWFAFGDSITSLGWYIGAADAELGTRSVNFGHSGFSFPELAQFYTEMTDTDFGPDLITIFAGTNDFGQSRPVKDTQSSLRVILKGLYAAYPRTQVIVITPLQRNVDPEVYPAEVTGLGPNKEGHCLIDYVKAIRETAAEFGTPCLDLYACGGINEINAREKTMNGDGLHPSMEYAPVIGHIIAQFILQYAPME